LAFTHLVQNLQGQWYVIHGGGHPQKDGQALESVGVLGAGDSRHHCSCYCGGGRIKHCLLESHGEPGGMLKVVLSRLRNQSQHSILHGNPLERPHSCEYGVPPLLCRTTTALLWS